MLLPRTRVGFWLVVVFLALPFIGLLADDDGQVFEPYRASRFADLDAVELPVVDGTTDDSFIIVEKQTDPDGFPRTFVFTGDASGELRDGEVLVVGPLPAGNYTTQEQADGDFDLVSIECSPGGSFGDLKTRVAHFEVGSSEAVLCTFTNSANNLLFWDHFESGDTSAWTATMPPPPPACNAVCEVGPAPPSFSCSPCVEQVCDDDPACCSLGWDERCVEAARTLCGAGCP